MAEPPTAVQLPKPSKDAAAGESTAATPEASKVAAGDAAEASTTTRPASDGGKSSVSSPQAVSGPASESTPEDDSVFLKQDGKVYLVKDWATLQRWIMERRVGREDLVSEGGVRWEPIGGRPELGSFFAAVEQLEAAELAGLRGNDTPFPTDGEPEGWAFDEPDGDAAPSGLARLDDETEGVPIGLPPLPTEDLDGSSDDESAYPDAPPSRLEAASPPADHPAEPEPEPEPQSEDDVEDDVEDEPPFAVIVEEDDEALQPTAQDEPDSLEPDSLLDSGESLASTVPFVDPTPSMPIFSEEDEASVFSESMPLHDTPVFGGREVAASQLEGDESLFDQALDEEDDGEVLLDPFAGSADASAAEAELHGQPPVDAASLPPDDEWIEPPESVVDDPAPPEPAPSDEAEAEPDIEEEQEEEEEGTADIEDAQPTDEFDPDDPFRTFEDPVAEEPAVVRAGGPPPWLVFGAVAVLTIAALLGLYVAAQNGWFSPEATEPDTVADVQTPPVPQTPATAAVDSDVADSDAADSDVPDTDAPDTDVDTADADEPDTEGVADADVEPDTEPAPPAATPPAATPPTRPQVTPTRSLKTRGWAAMDKSRWGEAEEAFRRVVQTQGQDAEAHLGLGVALLQQGRTSDAQASLCRASRIGNTDIQRQASGMLQQASLTCN